MSKNITVAVLGAGNMGTAVAKLLGDNGCKVKIWNYEGDAEPLNQIKAGGENTKYLPGIKLAASVSAEPDLKEAVKGAAVVFFALPSNFMPALIARVKPFLGVKAVSAIISKGLDEKTLSLISAVMKKNLGTGARVVSISGPAVARGMAEGDFTAMNVAGKDKQAIKIVQMALQSEHLKLIPSDDAIGVEMGGSFKNVYAMALGICDGLGIGLNTKAAILVVALDEMARLIVKMGGKEKTIYGLAGLGDLIGTGLSPISRNRRFGEEITKGLGKEAAAKAVGQTVEGAGALKVLLALSKKQKVKLPLAEVIFRVIYDGRPAKEEMNNFLKNFQ